MDKDITKDIDTEQEQEPDPQYVQGYNEGYFLAKELPQFAGDMARHLPETERSNGFRGGVEQYSRDLSKYKQQTREKEFKDNNKDIGTNKNSREQTSKDYLQNKNDIGVDKTKTERTKAAFTQTKTDIGLTNKDKHTSWLNDKNENKKDMGLEKEKAPDRDRDKPKTEYEPKMD